MVTSNSNSEMAACLKYKLDRSEKRWIVGIVITVTTFAIGGFAALMVFVFQTNTDAIAAHAEIERKASEKRATIEQKIAVEKALTEERKETRDERDATIDKRLNDQGTAIGIVHTNVQRLLWEKGMKAKPMPAGIRLGVPDP